MKKLLEKRIEQLRIKLNKLVELYGTQNLEVIKCSQELDSYIYKAYGAKRHLCK